jgi:hypothetical protein
MEELTGIPTDAWPPSVPRPEVPSPDVSPHPADTARIAPTRAQFQAA